MKVSDLPIEFKEALPVLDNIHRHGFDAYFVGGSVRDILLEHPIHDVDIATSAFPEEIKKIFNRTIDVGIDHGTVLVLTDNGEYEVTTFRTESTYQDYRRPDDVTFVRSLEEDLKRRDFTMNALAMSKEGHIIDLFEGLEAIKNRQIIAVGNPTERFHEDALRMMRAVRFASQLDFDIESTTLEAMVINHRLLSKISIERIYAEWVKLLLGKNRRKGLIPFIETESYTCCPGLNDKQAELLIFSEKSPDIQIDSEELGWVLLLISLDEKNMSSFLRKWKASNKMIKKVSQAVTMYRMRETTLWTPYTLYQSGVSIIQLVEQARVFYGYEDHEKDALISYDILPIHTIQELDVSGHDLMIALNKKPGKWLGELLNELEHLVVDGQLINEKENLITFVKKKGEKNE